MIQFFLGFFGLLETSSYLCTQNIKNEGVMCTITLSYNEKDKVASEKLAALLSTGLFVQLNRQEDLDIDYTDSTLYEIDPSLPEINRDLTPQELEALILEDIHSIYEGKHAV